MSPCWREQSWHLNINTFCKVSTFGSFSIAVQAYWICICSLSMPFPSILNQSRGYYYSPLTACSLRDRKKNIKLQLIPPPPFLSSIYCITQQIFLGIVDISEHSHGLQEVGEYSWMVRYLEAKIQSAGRERAQSASGEQKSNWTTDMELCSPPYRGI